MSRTLTIDLCPHDVHAIAIDSEHHGIRLTPEKCCGGWVRIVGWSMTPEALREIANTLECEAEYLEQEQEKGEGE